VSDYRNQPLPQGGWPSQPPDAPPPASRAVRPRRRRRRGVWLLAALVVIVVLLVVADFGAKAYAENTIAGRIDSSGLGTKPSVTIEGFPFLTQNASHDVKTIDISASGAKAGKVPFNLTAKATGVHLNSSFNSATIDQINGNATFTYASLETLLPVPGITLAADPADGPDAMKLSTPVGDATGKIQLTGTNTVTLQLGSLSGLGGLASLLGGGTTLAQSYTIDIPKLPAGLAVKSVAVTSQGIVATAAGHNTTLTQ
jgi:hypothetical protein